MNDAGVPVTRLRDEFQRWCAQQALAPPAGADLGRAMGALFDRLGVALDRRDGELMAMGVAIDSDAPQALLPAPSRLGRMRRRSATA